VRSGRPAGLPKAQQTASKAVSDVRDRRPRNNYRSLIHRGIRKACGCFENSRRQGRSWLAISSIAGRFSHLLPWILIGGVRKVNTTESDTFQIFKKKNFQSFFPHKTNKLLNFHIFISDALQVPCSFSGEWLSRSDIIFWDKL
jgi:hypothetical protein